MSTTFQPHASHDTEHQHWPEDVKFMLSVLAERPDRSDANRRDDARRPYRRRATVHLIDGAGNTWREVHAYTRDVNETGLGLLSNIDLPVGSRAILHLPSPGGRVWHIACSVV